MKWYKFIIFIIALLMSPFLIFLSPSLHKPLVLEKEDFVLKRSYEEPSGQHTLKLFKVGDAPVKDKQLIAVIPDESKQGGPQVKIEPSAFYQYANREKTTAKPVQSSPETSATPSESFDEPDQQEEFESDKPTDKSFKGRMLQRKEETIAWNNWRSDLQNAIMVDASVSAPLGTMFFFTFKVDKNRHISNIKVLCTNPMYQKQAAVAITAAIKNYEGSDFLIFPPKTKRTSVKFEGSYMIWFETSFASPENFSDFERIHYYE